MYNLRLIIRNTRILLMIATMAIPGWVTAAEIQWVPVKDKAGLSVMMPGIGMDVLVDDIVRLKLALKHDEKLLSRREERKRITGNQSVLSFLLPGGMLYAAYKKHDHANAVRDHEQVSSMLKEITSDLVALTTISGPIVVAKR